MTEKKRTTVTTIETHEVWIIRKPALELFEREVLIPDEITNVTTVSPLGETENKSEERTLRNE